MIPVGDFLPDLPDRDNPGLLRAENVIPLAASYGAFRSLVEDSSALDDRCLGARPLKDFNDEVYNFAGDTSKLYELKGPDYITRGSGYTMLIKHRWEFFAFNGKAYACGGYQPLQEAVMDGDFADVALDPDSAAAPLALHADVVGNFIVTGNQILNPQEVIWSAIGRADKWAPATEKELAGAQTLQQGGPITRVLGGEYGIIFCESAIYRMTFQGDPDIVFSIKNVAPGSGTVAPGSVVQIGNLIYYLGADGFSLFDGASPPRPIGSNTFNSTFLEEMYDSNYPEAISGIADLQNTMIFWSYVSKDSPVTGVPDRIICYNWTTQKFAGPINVPTEMLVYSLTPVVQSDDPTVGIAPSDGGAYGPLLLDGDIFKGGNKATVSAFTLDHKHANAAGPPLVGTVETGEYSLNKGGFSHVTGVRAVVEGDSPEITLALGFRDTTSGPVRYTGPVSPNSRTELAPFRQNNRYHRLRVVVGGDFSEIVGFDPEVIGQQTR